MAIYLDHNSTTPVLPEVAAAMAEAMARAPGNPESQHSFGRVARRMLEDARERIGELLGADAASPGGERVIFTSGGTESNNAALTMFRIRDPGSLHFIISSIEHPSVAKKADAFGRPERSRIRMVSVSSDGVVSVEQFASLLATRPWLASVMLANNETGVIQPIAHLAELATAADVPLHTDATQAVGKIPVNFRNLGVAALTAAAHKFHGPVGVGVLIARSDLMLVPLLRGGAQQQELRPGTESVPLAVGMCTALEIAHRELTDRQTRMKHFRDQLERALVATWPRAEVIGQRAERLPNTLCIAFPGIDRQALVMALDLAGIACSTGSACASGSSLPSPTLVAMGLPDEVVKTAVRFSVGATTTQQEIDEAIPRITATVLRTAGARPAPPVVR